MSEPNYTPLTQAARFLRSHPAALRKTINRFGIVERDGRQRVIPNDILDLFHRTKTASGYLYPVWVRTRDDLIAAAAQKIPASISSKGRGSRQGRGKIIPPRRAIKEKELA